MSQTYLKANNAMSPVQLADGSDDEIVWGLSDGELSPSIASLSLPGSVTSEYLIISRSQTPQDQIRCVTASDITSLTAMVHAMDISNSSTIPKKIKKKKKQKVKPAVVSSSDSAALEPPPKKPRKAKNKAPTPVVVQNNPYPSPKPSPKRKATPRPKRTKQGARPVVDNLSVVEKESPDASTLYEEASTFISRFLTNSEAKGDSVCKLTFLRSLIIELGLATSNLPASLRAARGLLKAHAFLNIREYLAVRGEGPEAIKRVMFPNRHALIKSIRKNPKNRAPLKWVKDMGLQVLLVGWAH